MGVVGGLFVTKNVFAYMSFHHFSKILLKAFFIEKENTEHNV